MNKSTALRLSLLSILVGLFSCSKKDDGTSTPIAKKLGDITDYSTCSGQSPADLSLYTTWIHKSRVEGEIDLDLYIRFEKDSVTLKAICSKDSLSTAAVINSPIAVNENRLLILANTSETQTKEIGRKQINCSVSLEKESHLFSFQGSCLKLSLNGQKEKLFVLAPKSEHIGP